MNTDKYARARAAERDPHIDPAHVRRTERRLARTNSPTKKKPLVKLNPYALDRLTLDRLTRSLPDFSNPKQLLDADDRVEIGWNR